MANNIQEIMSGKNINFLIGSGASMPYLSTLSLGDCLPSFENIVSSDHISEINKQLLYIYYFEKWISKMAIDRREFEESGDVGKNYLSFIDFLCYYLHREGNERPKRINIFTTNYDLFFERTFDMMSENSTISFYNDGSRGFIDRHLSISNYHLNVSHSGVNDFFKREIPTINLFKLHGSVSWKRDDNKIKIDYSNQEIRRIKRLVNKRFTNLSSEIDLILEEISILNMSNESNLLKTIEDKLGLFTKSNQLKSEDISSIYDKYKELPIINPNKWKFNRTVFEQHYYQLLRELNYELEREDSMLIVFGFSFQDEHILDIVKRSLVNPKLHMIVICFDKDMKTKIMNLFPEFPSIEYISIENEQGDFSFLNNWIRGKTNV